MQGKVLNRLTFKSLKTFFLQKKKFLLVFVLKVMDHENEESRGFLSAFFNS